MIDYAFYHSKLAQHPPILDAGCGDGAFLTLCHAQGTKAEGIDIDAAKIAACRKQGYTVQKADIISHLRNSKKRYGAIFAAHLIEHLEPKDVPLFLKLCHQALKPEGRLALVTPNSKNLGIICDSFWRDPEHKRPYPRSLLKEMFQSAGFKVVDTGIDPRSAPRGIFWVAKLVRRALVGNYFEGPDAYVLAEKL